MLQQVCGAGGSALRLLNSAIGGSKLSLSLGVRDGTGFYRFLCLDRLKENIARGPVRALAIWLGTTAFTSYPVTPMTWIMTIALVIYLVYLRRQVRLGRRNNDFIEVLSGLKPGERVITSSYSGLVDKDHLTFRSGE